MANNFDFEAALKQLQSGQPLTGENGILTPLIKQLTEAALNAEIENYLEENPKPSNRRNGYSRKTVKSSSGSFELETPRDRTGDFEPQLVKKNQTKLSEEIDNKVISLFALGTSYRDIQKHIADMYALDISEGAITNITDKLIPDYVPGNRGRLMPYIPLCGSMPSITRSRMKAVMSTKPFIPYWD